MKAKFAVTNTILKELKKGFIVEVGIMGEQAAAIHKVRNDDDELVEPKKPVTNAFIGAVHEYGCVSRNIPARSFLRMPLESRMPLVLKASADSLVEYLAKGRLREWLVQLGAKAEKIVNEAFHTSGWGTWKALKASTIRHRKKGKEYNAPMPLLDTGQLSASISSRVVSNED